ncbi:MAG: cell envelope integrity protein TolA [Deltaproteobacteria bacterium]|nr:cell envelope integrity protein TolA [Deltaproteobacteria bacterium]
MGRREVYKPNYSLGIIISCLLHIVGGITASILLEQHAQTAMIAPQIFSVTLEGGEKLGGVSQAPIDDKPQKIKAVPQNANQGIAKEDKTTEKKVEISKEELNKAQATEKEAKIDAPTAVEEAEKKKKEEAEKKKLEEQKKKEEEAKKVAEDKKRAEEEKAAEEKEREAREKLLKDRLKKFKSRLGSEEAQGNYTGESANAGGEGFGAAKLGGKGMGGGTLASAEFIAYRNALEEHIKGGWHWMEGGKRLSAQVLMQISSAGVIEGVEVTTSSGNSYFDDSVRRAVLKASPVPTPPATLYEQFKEVRITFDSSQ